MPKYCIHNVMSVIKLFKVAHGRHKITPYVDCVTKELRSNPAFEITQNRTAERFQKQITNLYPVFLNYFVFYHLKFVSAGIFCHRSV